VVAWTLFGAVSTIAALSCVVFNPRDGRVVGVLLVVAVYGVAVAALLWAAFETTRSQRRERPEGAVDRAGRVSIE